MNSENNNTPLMIEDKTKEQQAAINEKIKKEQGHFKKKILKEIFQEYAKY